MHAKLKEFEEITDRFRVLETEILKDIQAAGKVKGYNWPLHAITNLFVGKDYVSFKMNGLPKRLEIQELYPAVV
jgi:hypothetical protein